MISARLQSDFVLKTGVSKILQFHGAVNATGPQSSPSAAAERENDSEWFERLNDRGHGNRLSGVVAAGSTASVARDMEHGAVSAAAGVSGKGVERGKARWERGPAHGRYKKVRQRLSSPVNRLDRQLSNQIGMLGHRAFHRDNFCPSCPVDDAVGYSSNRGDYGRLEDWACRHAYCTLPGEAPKAPEGVPTGKETTGPFRG